MVSEDVFADSRLMAAQETYVAHIFGWTEYVGHILGVGNICRTYFWDITFAISSHIMEHILMRG